jgi:hypothetical protein
VRRHLRIKKVYFDVIARGEKTKEYRSVTKHYDFLAHPELDEIVLHYQRPPRVTCDVVSVRVIDCPQRLRESADIQFTPRVYEITLSNPRLTRAKEGRPPKH